MCLMGKILMGDGMEVVEGWRGGRTSSQLTSAVTCPVTEAYQSHWILDDTIGTKQSFPFYFVNLSPRQRNSNPALVYRTTSLFITLSYLIYILLRSPPNLHIANGKEKDPRKELLMSDSSSQPQSRTYEPPSTKMEVSHAFH